MHHTVPVKLGARQARDHPKHTRLLWPLEIGLKADDVVHRGREVILTELDDSPGAMSSAWIAQTNRTQRSITQRFTPAPGHDLDRQATFKKKLVFALEHLELN